MATLEVVGGRRRVRPPCTSLMGITGLYRSPIHHNICWDRSFLDIICFHTICLIDSYGNGKLVQWAKNPGTLETGMSKNKRWRRHLPVTIDYVYNVQHFVRPHFISPIDVSATFPYEGYNYGLGNQESFKHFLR